VSVSVCQSEVLWSPAVTTKEGSPPHRENASTVVSRHRERTHAECDDRIRDSPPRSKISDGTKQVENESEE